MTTLGELAVRVRDAATPAATARHALTEIEARVTRAASRHRGRQALARRQRAVEAEFGDLTVGGSAEAAAEVLQRVREATDEPAVDRLVGELRGLRARATAVADRSFAITQAAEVLRALGYHVDQDEPADNGTSRMVATSARWPRHGLRLVFRSDQPGIHSSPMALSATDARDDVAFEEASCTDIGRLRAELERRGVTTRMTHHVPPGQLAVRREYAAQDRTSTGTATAAKPRERSR